VTIPIALILLAATWPQFGRDSSHTGNTTVPGQPFQTVLAAVTMDPFVAVELELFGDDLRVHYAAPIIEGDDVVLHVEQIGELFDVPLTVTLQYADKKPVDVLVPVTERAIDMRVALAGRLRGVQISKDDGTMAVITRDRD